MMHTSTNHNVIEQAKEYLLNLFNLLHKPSLLYHNFHKIEQLLDLGESFCTNQNCTNEEKEIIQLCLLFAHSGYLTDYADPEEKSIKEAISFLKDVNYNSQKLNLVIECLEKALYPSSLPGKKTEMIVSDCLQAADKNEDFPESIQLLRLEKELLTGHSYSNLQWNQLLLQEINQTRYFTTFGKVQFEPLLANHIIFLRNQINKANRANQKENLQPDRFNQLEPKIPERGIQSFFRSNFRNHIHLSAIADNKANIMISINAILISILITALTYQNITQTKPGILLPVILFLLTGLTSLIFAVLSIRPKVTSNISPNQPDDILRKDITFFGNFVQLDLDRYEKVMDGLLRNGEHLYRAMTRDLYFLGKVLDKKYKYLTWSYNIFMVGFVATVVSFLIILFF